jgi:archaellum biogenesis ATPase FlaH
MSDKLSPEFITELFYSCVQNKQILEICVLHLKEIYLPTEEQRFLLTEIKKFNKSGFKKLTWGVLDQICIENEAVQDYLATVKNTPEEIDHDAMLEQLEAFIKQSKFIDLYDKTHSIYSRGKKKEAYKILFDYAEELSKFSLRMSAMKRILGDFSQRHVKRVLENSSGATEKIPFGIDPLDRMTNGGPETGELVMFLGDAKSGKSILLIHCGINAMRRGHAVYHVQAEGTEQQVLRRYDSAWSGTLYYDVKEANMTEKTFAAHKKLIDNLGSTDVYVDCQEKFMAVNMIDIRKRLIELKKTADVKVVVIDYVDVINPDGEKYLPSDERHRQQKTVRMMKDLAVEQKVIIYTATQASSIAKELLDDPNFHITAEHLAEDKGKVRPVDMLFSINRTTDERRNKIARIYPVVLREHSGGDSAIIAQSLGNTRFYDRKRTIELDLNDTQEMAK